MEPALTRHVYGACPPDAVKPALNATPATAAGSPVVATETAGKTVTDAAPLASGEATEVATIDTSWTEPTEAGAV
jgi:hypothetical protein